MNFDTFASSYLKFRGMSSWPPSTTKAKLNKCIEMRKNKANKHGFNLQTGINQVLASKDIMFRICQTY